MRTEKLVYMANQIGKFFVSEDKATAVASIADHLEKFWDPRMRAEIVAYAKAGGAELSEAAKEAVLSLKPVAPLS